MTPPDSVRSRKGFWKFKPPSRGDIRHDVTFKVKLAFPIGYLSRTLHRDVEENPSNMRHAGKEMFSSDVPKKSPSSPSFFCWMESKSPSTRTHEAKFPQQTPVGVGAVMSGWEHLLVTLPVNFLTALVTWPVLQNVFDGHMKASKEWTPIGRTEVHVVLPLEVLCIETHHVGDECILWSEMLVICQPKKSLMNECSGMLHI